MSDKEFDDNYEVGYRRPPKRTQFQKGQSGNPSGRPKGSKNVPTMLYKVCNAPVTIKEENGRKRRISKVEAIMMQLANAAARGDSKAARTFFSIVKEFPIIMERPIEAVPSVLHIQFVESDGNGNPKPGTEERLEREIKEWEEQQRELKKRKKKMELPEP